MVLLVVADMLSLLISPLLILCMVPSLHSHYRNFITTMHHSDFSLCTKPCYGFHDLLGGFFFSYPHNEISCRSLIFFRYALCSLPRDVRELRLTGLRSQCWLRLLCKIDHIHIASRGMLKLHLRYGSYLRLLTPLRSPCQFVIHLYVSRLLHN